MDCTDLALLVVQNQNDEGQFDPRRACRTKLGVQGPLGNLKLQVDRGLCEEGNPRALV